MAKPAGLIAAARSLAFVTLTLGNGCSKNQFSGSQQPAAATQKTPTAEEFPNSKDTPEITVPVGDRKTIPGTDTNDRCSIAETDIATIDPETCKVTGKNEGTTKVTVTNDDGKKSTVVVHVTDDDSEKNGRDPTDNEPGIESEDDTISKDTGNDIVSDEVTAKCGDDSESVCFGIGGPNCSFWFTRSQEYAREVVDQALSDGQQCNDNARFVHIVCKCPIDVSEIPKNGASPWCVGNRCATGKPPACQSLDNSVCGPKG